jgi:hypothetical protein
VTSAEKCNHFFAKGFYMFSFICLLVLFCWAINHWVKKLDDDGAVRSAAKQGLINMFSRWTK